MNRRFALPIAITLSAHAILLLGSSRPTPHPPIKIKDISTIELVPVAPEEKEIMELKDLEAAYGKKDVEAPPSLPPLAPVVEVKAPFTMTEPPTLHSDKLTMTNVIPDGPPGTTDGKGTDFKSAILVSIDQLDNPPKTKFQASPQYPYALKTAGITGKVMVEFTVDETGRVLNPHVLSSDHPEFESPTLRAVQTWRFQPGKRLGKAVRFKMAVPVQFSISDRDE